eukprot:2327091-Rhodomonas_salina.2
MRSRGRRAVLRKCLTVQLPPRRVSHLDLSGRALHAHAGRCHSNHSSVRGPMADGCVRALAQH